MVVDLREGNSMNTGVSQGTEATGPVSPAAQKP
jgi:hypothetical protein